MSQYDVGDRITLSTVVRNESGTPVNTPTLTIAVTRPDATTTSPAVTNTGAGGVYTAQATADQAGLWTGGWTASGTVVAYEPFQFTVAAARALVASMEEFKTHLNRTDATDDAELRSYLAAATDWVEQTISGPVVPTSVTEVLQCRGSRIFPSKRPLISVTSITPELGSALDTTLFLVDTRLSMIRLLSGYGRTPTWHTVAYRAGLSAIPERVKLAGLIVAAHLWQVQNGGAGLPFPGDAGGRMGQPVAGDLAAAGMGYAVPNRARDLLQPYVVPRIA